MRFQLLSRGRRCAAFTLVELLVVIAIIGALVAILLPAVQAAREAARRIKCRNNLKQFGIAMHVYHDTFQLLPHGGPGMASLTIPAAKARNELSWGAALLPGLEQTNLYEKINQQEPYLHASNLEAGQTILPVFTCPSGRARDERKPNGDTPNSTTLYGRSDYGGNWGERALRCYPSTNCQNNYSDKGDTSGHGRGLMLMGTEKRLGFKDVLDGTTRTIAIGEAPEALHGIWIGHKNVFDQSAPVNARVKTGSPWQSCGAPFKSKFGNFCDYGQEFHSWHLSGCQFLMLDGSAHFVSESIDYKVFAALLSYAGQEDVVIDF